MGGGSEIFYLRIKELFFFPCPCLTPIVSDIQYDLNEEKVQNKGCEKHAVKVLSRVVHRRCNRVLVPPA